MSSVMLRNGSTFQTREFHFQISKPGIKLILSLALIGVISIVDIWFAVANSSILHVEKNPICEFLLRLDPHSCVFFVAGKLFGTVFVLSALSLMHCFNYRHAKLVTRVVLVFQIALFTFLTLSDPLNHNLPNFGLLFGQTPESIWVIE